MLEKKINISEKQQSKMLQLNTGIKEDLKETIVQKVFEYIRTYYGTFRPGMYTDTEIIGVIENILIELESTEYFLIGEKDFLAKPFDYQVTALSSFEYLDKAKEIYNDIQSELEKFDRIRKNCDAYRDDTYTDDQVEETLLSTIFFIRGEISRYNISRELKEEITDYLNIFESNVKRVDAHIDRKSQLLSYISLLRSSKVNFVDITKDGEKFYPVIVDFFLDYMRITSIQEIEEKDIKKYNNDHKLFRERIIKKRLDISRCKYFMVRFDKQTRGSRRKNFILSFYLKKLDNTALNSLFRKLFNINENNRVLTKKDMDSYSKKISPLGIFIMGKYSKYFL